MKLLEIFSKKGNEKVYRVKGTDCIYKFEKGVLYVRNVNFKTWHESSMEVNNLKNVEVEEITL